MDVRYEGEIIGFQGGCTYDLEDDGSGRVTVTVAVRIGAARGPADRDRRAAFRYFVALADARREVLSKALFETEVAFPGNLSRNAVTDLPVDITIPLEAGQRGTDFLVYLGFQLTAREVDFNRHRQGTAP